jgi:hypothetical protein
MISYGDIKSGEATMPATEIVLSLDIDLSDIRLDQSAQPRESLNNDRIAEYAEAMKAGDQFPPLTVFNDGKTYWLADGFHRHYAAQHAGRKHIRCHVRQGGLRDAILYSVGANAKHGLARSDEDKRRAVARLLTDEEWSQWSDREIARRCSVGNKLVGDVRRSLTVSEHSDRAYRTKHGTVATMKTAGINANRQTNAPGRASINDDPSPEAGPQAEASLAGTGTGMPADREGRHEGEAASVDLPTNLRNIFDELVALWIEATDEDREAFIAYLRVSGVIVTESNPATGTGGDDVDRSAERASSAVKVGATNSPDGATKYQAQVTRQPEGERSTVGEAVASPAPRNSEMPANPAASPARQATAAPEVAPPPASGATTFKTLSKADQIRLLRPHCQHPGSDLCGGSGRRHCSKCAKAAEEGEAA